MGSNKDRNHRPARTAAAVSLAAVEPAVAPSSGAQNLKKTAQDDVLTINAMSSPYRKYNRSLAGGDGPNWKTLSIID